MKREKACGMKFKKSIVNKGDINNFVVNASGLTAGSPENLYKSSFLQLFFDTFDIRTV